MTSVPYKTLNQYHNEYCAETIEKLEHLYQGSFYITKPDVAKHYIPREPGEPDQVYKARLSCATYINYLAQIINDYVAETFSKQLIVLPAEELDEDLKTSKSIDPVYDQFQNDADLQGNSIAHVLRCTLTNALLYNKAYLGIDFPRSEIEAQNLLQEEKLGLARPYLYEIATESVIDYEMDDFGNFLWLVLKKEFCPRQSPLDSRNQKIIQFKVWEKDPDSKVVSWKLFQIVCEDQKEPSEEDLVSLIDEDTVSFSEIPIVCLHIPKSLAIGSLIGALCATHYRRLSSLHYAENRSLFAIAVYKQGPELPANGDLSDIAQNPHRGNQAAAKMERRNFAVIGPQDEISFAEPAGSSYQLIHDQLKDLIDEVYRIVNNMSQSVSSNSKGLQRAAQSRQLDQRGKEKVLEAYADEVKQLTLKVYDLIAEARNEDIEWAAVGMSDYKVINREQIISEAVQMAQIPINSKTFKSHYYSKVAYDLVEDLPPHLQKDIKEEIMKSVEKQEKQDEEMQKQQLLQSKQPNDMKKPKSFGPDRNKAE